MEKEEARQPDEEETRDRCDILDGGRKKSLVVQGSSIVRYQYYLFPVDDPRAESRLRINFHQHSTIKQSSGPFGLSRNIRGSGPFYLMQDQIVAMLRIAMFEFLGRCCLNLGEMLHRARKTIPFTCHQNTSFLKTAATATTTPLTATITAAPVTAAPTACTASKEKNNQINQSINSTPSTTTTYLYRGQYLISTEGNINDRSFGEITMETSYNDIPLSEDGSRVYWRDVCKPLIKKTKTLPLRVPALEFCIHVKTVLGDGDDAFVRECNYPIMRVIHETNNILRLYWQLHENMDRDSAESYADSYLTPSIYDFESVLCTLSWIDLVTTSATLTEDSSDSSIADRLRRRWTIKRTVFRT